MPRRRPEPRRRPAAATPHLNERVEVGPDGYDYHVRTVTGSRATKTYRCPGCDHEVRPGVAHVVVWPADGLMGESGLEDRRHWHAPCWTNRANRSPTRRWT